MKVPPENIEPRRLRVNYIQVGPDRGHVYDVMVYRNADGSLVAFDKDGNDVTAPEFDSARMRRVLTERLYLADVPYRDNELEPAI